MCSKAKIFFILRYGSFLPRASESQCIFVFILFILISLFLFVYLFRFQLSNGFYHCSLSSDPSVASVGAGPFPHFPPVSRAWTRAPSALLPDYVHYYTIGPGMLPSSKIPSWKVCVPFVVASPHLLMPSVRTVVVAAFNPCNCVLICSVGEYRSDRALHGANPAKIQSSIFLNDLA